MNKADFLQKINDLMEREEPLAQDSNLTSMIEWDSLTALGVLALFSNELSIQLKANQLKEVVFISDLIALTQDKLT